MDVECVEYAHTVDVSPTSLYSPAAKQRSILRVIFPLRVLGSSDTIYTNSGTANDPIFALTVALMSFFSPSVSLPSSFTAANVANELPLIW